MKKRFYFDKCSLERMPFEAGSEVMINVIKSEERYQADFGWLKTKWHFSFGDYWDPGNVSFGPLRVFNDDVVEAGKGFDMHPHRDMEIVTYVVEGELAHKDHLGNRGVVRSGEVQLDLVAGEEAEVVLIDLP